MKKNLTSSTQTAGAKAAGAARSFSMKITDADVLSYIRIVRRRTGMTRRLIAENMLTTGFQIKKITFPAEESEAAK